MFNDPFDIFDLVHLRQALRPIKPRDTVKAKSLSLICELLSCIQLRPRITGVPINFDMKPVRSLMYVVIVHLDQIINYMNSAARNNDLPWALHIRLGRGHACHSLLASGQQRQK